MAQDRYVYTSFTTGEVTPEFYARFHDEKFAAGAADVYKRQPLKCWNQLKAKENYDQTGV